MSSPPVNLRGHHGERAESGDREGRPRLSASPGAAEVPLAGWPGQPGCAQLTAPVRLQTQLSFRAASPALPAHAGEHTEMLNERF